MTRLTKATGLTLVALLATTLPVVAQANVAGNWVFTVESPESPGEILAVFAQDGAKVTGSLELPLFGSAEMSDGTVEANTFSFTLGLDMEGQRIEIAGQAEVDGDAMRGSFNIAEFGSFPFHGVRAPSPT